MAPYDSYDTLIVQDVDTRPRKYSETYREVAAVDSNDDVSVISSREQTTSVENIEKRFEDDAVQEDGISSNDEESSSPCSNGSLKVTESSPHPKISESHFLPDVHEPNLNGEAYLHSRPVAMAAPEIEFESLASTSRIATATQVVRMRTSEAPNDRNASLISVKVFKASKDVKLGLRLGLTADGHLQLTKVGNLMKESPLRVGDELLRLNGQDVSAWTATAALQYLREAWGWLSLTVRNPKSDASLALASVCKSSATDRLGISFCSGANRLTVHGLNVAGLLGGRTTISMGDVVESINSIECSRLDNAIAVSMIRSIPDWVHILVRKPILRDYDEKPLVVASFADKLTSLTPNDGELSMESTDAITQATEVINPLTFEDGDDFMEPALVSVSFSKTKQTEKLGLSLAQVEGSIYIKKISQGALSQSCLREGMMLLAINHLPTCRLSLSDASDFLKNRVGSITLLARHPHGNPKYVQSMVYKRSSEQHNLVGVSFKGSSGRQLKLCEIRKNGLFVNSALNIGDSVVRINEIPCAQWRPKEAVDLVRASDRIVSILAKSKSKSGVIVGKLSVCKQ